jgi:hypothetical protein
MIRDTLGNCQRQLVLVLKSRAVSCLAPYRGVRECVVRLQMTLG